MSNERTDARRHRLALLQAASEVFLEQGITAPLDLVVERAGVGRATLYRHFPDRAALVFAMMDASLETLTAAAASVPQDETAFHILLGRLAGIVAKDPSLADFWRVIPSDAPERVDQLHRFRAIFERPIATAIAGGALRADFRSEDMLLVGATLGVVVRERDPDRRLAMVERLLDLMVLGLQPLAGGGSE